MFLLLATGSLRGAEISPSPLFESSLQTRVGFDSNPAGRTETAAVVSGDEDTFFFAAGANVSLALSPGSSATPALKLTYAGEVVRFEDCPDENFATHRIGWSGQFINGPWKFLGEGSSLYIAGSRDTLASVLSVNANAIPLWRERRRQWQHRLRLQAQTDLGTYVIRTTGSLLAYDYQTRAVAGKIPFADRSDAQVAIDLGWKRQSSSLWIAGVRAGRQNQAVVPLPNCEFDYSNNYIRLATGWEGKPSANTTATFAAGPDFRHYSGAIDPRIFLGERNRTSLWFEGSLTAKPRTNLTFTGKAAQMDWLSSTGKSAYVDTSAETTAAWTVTPVWTLRLSAKVHRCDYFPAARDDWESIFGAGVALKLTHHTLLTLDFLRHRGWNGLDAVSDRDFRRGAINLGAVIVL